MKTITAGYTAYNGHVFTQAEADTYNNACQDTARALKQASTGSALARDAWERAMARQHQLFTAIIYRSPTV